MVESPILYGVDVNKIHYSFLLCRSILLIKGIFLEAKFIKLNFYNYELMSTYYSIISDFLPIFDSLFLQSSADALHHRVIIFNVDF